MYCKLQLYQSSLDLLTWKANMDTILSTFWKMIWCGDPCIYFTCGEVIRHAARFNRFTKVRFEPGQARTRPWLFISLQWLGLIAWVASLWYRYECTLNNSQYGSIEYQRLCCLLTAQYYYSGTPIRWKIAGLRLYPVNGDGILLRLTVTIVPLALVDSWLEPCDFIYKEWDKWRGLSNSFSETDFLK